MFANFFSFRPINFIRIIKKKKNHQEQPKVYSYSTDIDKTYDIGKSISDPLKRKQRLSLAAAAAIFSRLFDNKKKTALALVAKTRV